jgi:hypothetical protein
LTSVEREHLVFRFGLYGVRVATMLIRDGNATTSAALSAALVARSGLKELESVLLSQFAGRADVLKARSAILAVESALREVPVAGSESLAATLERIRAGAHEFAEIRLLNALRSGGLKLREAEEADAERLLGADGTSSTARLGLPADADAGAVKDAATAALRRWRARAESPMSSREVIDASEVLTRTCEGLILSASAPGGSDALVRSAGT